MAAKKRTRVRWECWAFDLYEDERFVGKVNAMENGTKWSWVYFRDGLGFRVATSRAAARRALLAAVKAGR